MSKKKQEKRWLKMILLSVCMMLFFSLGVEMDANAASKSKSKTTTSSFVFSTPRGQTATAKVRARITEKYTKKGSKSTFNYRDCFISYNRTYSASAPKITRGNGVHKKSATGKTIKSLDYSRHSRESV